LSEAAWPGAPRVAVFVHGAGGGGWEWGVWSRVFAAHGFEVMAPDLVPGPAGLAATTLQDYAGQVEAWLGEAERRQPGAFRVLVGASLGGLLALMRAQAADALVLVNPMPPDGLPSPPRPAVVPWGRDASLAGTRRAMPDADDIAALFAFRRWRDESGRVLDQAAAGLAVERPRGSVLVLASDDDEDVPPERSETLARQLGARFQRWPGSHVGPLLGRRAADAAGLAVEWLNALRRGD
jgi:pimeloyl-ACP methyl ester carboxylesterase